MPSSKMDFNVYAAHIQQRKQQSCLDIQLLFNRDHFQIYVRLQFIIEHYHFEANNILKRTMNLERHVSIIIYYYYQEC